MKVDSRVAIATDLMHPRTGQSYAGQLATVHASMGNVSLVELDTFDGTDGVRLWFTDSELEELDYVG